MEHSADLTLVDAFVPKLVAGRYVLTASQTLHVDTENGAGDTVEKLGSKEFFVQGPRFALAADDIYSRFPAHGQSGPFSRHAAACGVSPKGTALGAVAGRQPGQRRDAAGAVDGAAAVWRG